MAALAGTVTGLALIVGGYLGAAGERSVGDEVAWLNLAVVGVIVAGCTELLWLVAGRQRVSLLRARVLELYDVPTPALVTSPGARRTGEWVTAAGSTWRHHRGCPLMTGKTELSATADGLSTCPVCEG